MKVSRDVWGNILKAGVDQVRERLRGKILRKTETGCWEIRGINHGYGQLKIAGQRVITHRAAWSLANSRDPGELLVCHSCDNRSCINPDHLFLGTTLDNMRDMAAKGRRAKQSEPRRRRVGSRLTIDDARAIIADPRDDAILARQYGVKPNYCRRIRQGRLWPSAQPRLPSEISFHREQV